VNVAVSPQFFGWLTGLSGRVKLLAPQEVVADYQKFLQEIMKLYM
jgi:hypothetical protein